MCPQNNTADYGRGVYLEVRGGFLVYLSISICMAAWNRNAIEINTKARKRTEVRCTHTQTRAHAHAHLLSMCCMHVCMQEVTGKIRITSSAFANNNVTTSGAGAGVYVYGSSSNVTIDDCYFVNNRADKANFLSEGSGAAIYIDNMPKAANISVTNSNFINNTCLQVSHIPLHVPQCLIQHSSERTALHEG